MHQAISLRRQALPLLAQARSVSAVSGTRRSAQHRRKLASFRPRHRKTAAGAQNSRCTKLQKCTILHNGTTLHNGGTAHNSRRRPGLSGGLSVSYSAILVRKNAFSGRCARPSGCSMCTILHNPSPAHLSPDSLFRASSPASPLSPGSPPQLACRNNAATLSPEPLYNVRVRPNCPCGSPHRATS